MSHISFIFTLSGLLTPSVRRRLKSIRNSRASVSLNAESVATSLTALLALEEGTGMGGVDLSRVGELYMLANPGKYC